MMFSGTSWGGIAFPGVYTSYDYGASVSIGSFFITHHLILGLQIAESRDLTTKYDELKRQSLFLRSSRDFYKTDWVADSSTGLSVSTNNDAFVTLLKNFDTGTQFFIARQGDSTST